MHVRACRCVCACVQVCACACGCVRACVCACVCVALSRIVSHCDEVSVHTFVFVNDTIDRSVKYIACWPWEQNTTSR